MLKVGAWTLPVFAVAVAAPAATASSSNAITVLATQIDFPQQGVSTFQILVRNLSNNAARVTVGATLDGDYVRLISDYSERWSWVSPATFQGVVNPGETADGVQFNVGHPGNAPAEPLPYTLTVIATAPGLADGMWSHTGTV